MKETFFHELYTLKDGLAVRLERNTDYVVCADGEIYRLTKKGPKKINGNPRATGYHAVTISDGITRKDFLIHRLVAEHFIENPDKLPVVNHDDGDKSNNHYQNLNWSTYQDNTLHAFNTGLMKVGNDHPRAKLREKDVIEMKERHATGESINSLASDYDVSWSTVRNAINGITWKHVK